MDTFLIALVIGALIGASIGFAVAYNRFPAGAEHPRRNWIIVSGVLIGALIGVGVGYTINKWPEWFPSKVEEPAADPTAGVDLATLQANCVNSGNVFTLNADGSYTCAAASVSAEHPEQYQPVDDDNIPAIVADLPEGWEEVEIVPNGCTNGRRLAFNHDADGQLEIVYITWGHVERLNAEGEVIEDLGNAIRLTQDPDGERLAVTGGWRKFRYTASQPDQAAIDALVTWAKGELASNTSFACDTVADYTVSTQEILHTSSEPIAGSDPTGWTEVALFPSGDSFVPAGDELTEEKDWDHQGNQRVTISWFWASPTKPTGSNGCTAYVITDPGKSTFWFQGGHRTWEYTGGNPTKDDIQNLVRWWIEKALETEPNGVGCSVPGAYTVTWQDPAYAPASSDGRP
jgi:hypothetical protein